MPWWSWVLIWVVLVLSLLTMLVSLALFIWRKLVALGAEVAATAGGLSAFNGTGSADSSTLTTQAVSGSADQAEQRWDLFTDPSRARANYTQGKADRRAQRRRLRVERRARRGQPQSLRDLEAEGIDLLH